MSSGLDLCMEWLGQVSTAELDLPFVFRNRYSNANIC